MPLGIIWTFNLPTFNFSDTYRRICIKFYAHFQWLKVKNVRLFLPHTAQWLLYLPAEFYFPVKRPDFLECTGYIFIDVKLRISSTRGVILKLGPQVMVERNAWCVGGYLQSAGHIYPSVHLIINNQGIVVLVRQEIHMFSQNKIITFFYFLGEVGIMPLGIRLGRALSTTGADLG